MREKKGIHRQNYETYMDKIFFDYINKKTMNNNVNKDESKNTTNNRTNKDETVPTNSNNSKSKKKSENNKDEKNKEIVIKKLENENAHLRKLLITYKLKKNKVGKSNEKIKKFYNYFFEKKIPILRINKTNNSYLSNLYPYNNDYSLNSNSNNISNTKNSLNNNLLDNIIDKITLIPKKNKSKKKNSESCSVLLTDGNIGRSLKRSKGKEIRSNSKTKKILISEIKINKTNTKIKKINKIKMNSIYYNKINNTINGKDNVDMNRNNILNSIGNFTFNSNYHKKKKNNIIKDKLKIKRNNNLDIKSSHQSLKLDNAVQNIIRIPNDNYLNNNKTNSFFHHGKIKIQKNIKSFNKILLGNIINHNSLHNTKKNNLFDKKRNIKLNKKKYNNYHSISSVVDTTKLHDSSKFNSSVSFDIKKLKLNENDKSINKNNILEKIIKKTNNTIENSKKNNFLKNNKNRIKYFMSYTFKMKKLINESMNKNLKNMNNNIRNDNKLNNSNKKKNNIFFTINKTIIHNMNNTFNNSNNKNCYTNTNNSEEVINNDTQRSPCKQKNSNENTNLYNVINLRKKLVSKSNAIMNNYNINNKYSVLKANINDRIKKVHNK